MKAIVFERQRADPFFARLAVGLLRPTPPSGLDHEHALRTPNTPRGERSTAKAKRSQRVTHNHTRPDPARLRCKPFPTRRHPLVVRSFVAQITILDGDVITILRVRQQGVCGRRRVRFDRIQA